MAAAGLGHPVRVFHGGLAAPGYKEKGMSFNLVIGTTMWWRMLVHMHFSDYEQDEYLKFFDAAFWQQLFEWYTAD